jgi:hypothetical protein
MKARCGHGPRNNLSRHVGVGVHFVAQVVFVGGQHVIADNRASAAARDGNGIALTVGNGIFHDESIGAVECDMDSSGERMVQDVVSVRVALSGFLIDPCKDELQDVAVDQIVVSSDLYSFKNTQNIRSAVPNFIPSDYPVHPLVANPVSCSIDDGVILDDKIDGRSNVYTLRRGAFGKSLQWP